MATHRSAKLIPLVFILIISFVLTQPAKADDVMIFTANQNWLSRVYVMDMGGGVIDFHEYDFYRFTGMEVVDGELYIAEAFAPRVYKVDPATGDLDVFIDDWSLYYFYDVAFDGTYFYVDEWDLNRYDIHGVKDGTAGFDEDVMGLAWDGSHLWTLNDANLIRCWDVSGWPTVTELPELAFEPPSPACRGLWFDGTHLWSAESGETLGSIFTFDFQGQVVQSWPEPAFSGWGACVVPGSTSEVEPSRALVCATPGLSPIPLQAGASTGTIRFQLPRPASARLDVLDLRGACVTTLVAGHLDAGWHRARWRADGCPSGVYWLRLQAGSQTTAVRMLRVR